jgi:4-diphosphocytidyl-2C-methyl-D-erythritol kinase
MSGSGATVYGVFESAEQAEKAARELRFSADSEECWVRVTRILANVDEI